MYSPTTPRMSTRVMPRPMWAFDRMKRTSTSSSSVVRIEGGPWRIVAPSFLMNWRATARGTPAFRIISASVMAFDLTSGRRALIRWRLESGSLVGARPPGDAVGAPLHARPRGEDMAGDGVQGEGGGWESWEK